MNNSKKKLLVLASTFPRWKQDTNPPFVYELSRRLTNDFDVTVLTSSFPGAKDSEKMSGINVIRFHYFIRKFEKLASGDGILPTLKKYPLYYLIIPFFVLGEYFAAQKLTKKEHFDVIHAHWIIPQGISAYFLEKKFNIPYIITSHGSDINGLQNKVFIKIKRIILKKAKRITVVSNALKKEIIKKIDSSLKIDVISMGVDSTLFNPNKYDKSIKKKHKITGPFLLFVGRLSDEKGVTYLIDAMPYVIKKNPSAKLLIIGSGPLEKRLKSQSKNLNLEKNIIFTGAIPNNELPKYYATSDIFIGPSIKTKSGINEGFGLTFVEAGMSGTTVIASNLEGIKDIIQNHHVGHLVNEKSSHEIEETLNFILSQGKEPSHHLEFANKFDWTNISNKYCTLIVRVETP